MRRQPPRRLARRARAHRRPASSRSRSTTASRLRPAPASARWSTAASARARRCGARARRRRRRRDAGPAARPDAAGPRRSHGIEMLVLDEADRMLDMGFIPDLKRIVAQLPRSAADAPSSPPRCRRGRRSSPRGSSAIRSVEVTPSATTVERIDQHVLFVAAPTRTRCLTRSSRDAPCTGTIFTRTKRGADRIVSSCKKAASTPTRSTATSRRTRAGARRFKSGRLRAAGRDRHRRPRPRRGRHLARHQLRHAERARDLRAPHRPHRAGGGRRHRDVVLRRRGGALPRGDRKGDPPQYRSIWTMGSTPRDRPPPRPVRRGAEAKRVWAKRVRATQVRAKRNRPQGAARRP